MVDTESINPIFACQSGLAIQHLGQAKIIETQLTGEVGLVMTAELRPGFADVRPLGKALAPPEIVLTNGMELREIIRDEAN